MIILGFIITLFIMMKFMIDDQIVNLVIKLIVFTLKYYK